VFTRLLRPLRDLVLPTQCALCRGWGPQRLCDDCRTRFAAPLPRCSLCALRVPAGVVRCAACIATPPPWDGALAAVDYAHPWDTLIRRFKFDAALDLADMFARLMADAVHAHGLGTAPLLLPVPLAAARLHERGYNQSWEIVRRLAGRLGVHVDAQLLRRVRDTAHQLAFPPAQRAANLHAAFAVDPRRAHVLHGRPVVLLDDVMTSGATAAELARTVRRAGAAEVQVWVLARTPAPGDRGHGR